MLKYRWKERNVLGASFIEVTFGHTKSFCGIPWTSWDEKRQVFTNDAAFALKLMPGRLSAMEKAIADQNIEEAQKILVETMISEHAYLSAPEHDALAEQSELIACRYQQAFEDNGEEIALAGDVDHTVPVKPEPQALEI